MTEPGIANGVILAENDALLRGVIRSVLVHAGLEVFVAADGAEAVTLARQFQAKLVLLDIGMPNLNGLLACEAIRTLPGYAKVPIVMLTGYSDERMRVAAMELGANDFITKPFRPDVLIERLAVHLGPLSNMPPATPGTSDGNATPKGPIRVWDIQGPGSASDHHTQLSAGREALRISRDAERKFLKQNIRPIVV